jgi:nitronate monooxygenase
MDMSIATPLTVLLGIQHPILLAPIDVIAGARLTAAVSSAGGFGILGGGYDRSGDRRSYRRRGRPDPSRAT